MATDPRASLPGRILTASFARPGLTVVLILALAAFGAVALKNLRQDVFPDLSAPIFNIIVQNPAMGAEELETAVAIPMEVALAGLPEVRRIRSTSQLGVTQVTVEFEPDADYFRSRQYVVERVAQAEGELPPGTDAPLVSSLTGRLNEVFEFTLEAEPGSADLMALRDLAEFDIKNRLLAVPGVAGVERLGGYLRQFQVLLDPDQLVARGITLNEVQHGLEGASVNASGGFVVQGPMEWTVRALGRAESVEDLNNTVVALRDGTPVLLGDVADVREAPALRRGMAHRLKGEVVSCRVSKQFGADTVRVTEGVRAAIDELRRSLPPGVALRVVYDQSELVGSALGGVGRAILLGAFLVVLVLFLMLGDWRAALIVTLTLPLSLALAGLLLKAAGIGLNTMTLGGLAIAVGLLVDAAIIVVENVIHDLREGKGRRSVRDEALHAALEVGRPIAFATLIVVSVFIPLFAMTGIEGRMYQPLAAAVVACLAASLALALTLVPVVSGLLLRAPREDAPEDVWLIRKAKAVYAPLLEACMRRAGLVRVVALAITVPALGLAFMVGSDFMPRLDEGAFLLQTVLPPEASLEEVDRLNHRVEDVLREFPEVEDVVRRTGRAERTEDPMPHTLSDVLVVLKKDVVGGREALEARMREAVEKVPGVSALFTTPLGMRIDEGLGGSPADLSVRIFGPDLDTLAALAERTRVLMAKVEGLEDLRVEKLSGLPQLRIQVNRAAVARVGLTPGDVIKAIRVGLVGEDAAQIWKGQRRYDLVLKLADHRRGDVNALRNLLVDGHDGTRIPLGQLATIEETFGAGSVRREAGSRRIAVEAGVSGRDLGGTAKELREVLATQLKLPTGYFVDVGGKVESQERAAQSLTMAIAVALLAVFILLYLALDSVAEALVILATLPDAFVGGILALLIAGETWNVSSLVGLIGLFGIAVQNGLVLVSQTKDLLARGKPFPEAVREASLGRVRPKLMTAGTAILGLLPLLVLPLHGTEIERPLAVVMVGGLVTSTLFTLLALPTFYALVHGLQERLAARRAARKATA
ncbi:efflux RND transporter permease subunit [Corallococcus praedator]|uniref:Efflux RND transporter permease subunit n=1 Tax=Corallococcus praedator TaxID=2316724 RepID=A0ABX9QQA1_9BACT|nr:MULTISPECIES: efflux RND transporter permease subunit [Corallococcus]RKH13360.1 efflux RND transporter permease subunit [Corallococcus sp. CA047B]RKH34412.1 efflux RND transporter permease subunit [Corallococcus sp. CA031C]RKI15536.1 efflux RND transporter permease subunit [Corallococcus praedator]